MRSAFIAFVLPILVLFGSPVHADELQLDVNGETVLEVGKAWYENPMWILVILVGIGLIVLLARRRRA